MVRIVEEFFVELFSGADAGEFDFDVFVGLVAVETDEGLGHFCYFNGFAHVEYVELSSLPIAPACRTRLTASGMSMK